jgi:hypothetical protein
MRKILMLTVVCALIAPAAAEAATVPVQSLNGEFAASNSTVTKTPDGVHFGTYADGGALGGTVTYTGFNGHALSQLTDFSYTFTYREAGNTTGAAPYARVFLDADPTVDSDGDGNPANDVDSDVILDPSFCAATRPDISTDLTYQMVGNSVRYGDDGCDRTNAIEFGQQPWATVVANHGTDTIVGLLVSQGNSTGTDVSALLRNITVNGTTFAFNVPPVGPPGPPGTTTIVQGSAGAQGPAGAQPTGSGVLGIRVASTCKGDDLLTLRVARRAGQRFLTARATLRGKRLKIKGRAITLDLRNRNEGNYDVKIVARYATKSGRVVTSTTHRVRSVACA